MASFSADDAFTKAIVCLLSEREPRRFSTNSKVELDNKWLKQANSKNYHHFFLRAHLRDAGYEPWQSNSIMNIVLVDDRLNKRVIGAKPPSEYMATFLGENERKLKRTPRPPVLGSSEGSRGHPARPGYLTGSRGGVLRRRCLRRQAHHGIRCPGRRWVRTAAHAVEYARLASCYCGELARHSFSQGTPS